MKLAEGALCLLLKLFELLFNRFNMPFDTYLFPLGCYLAIGVDDEGGTHHTHIFAAIVLFELPAPEHLTQLLLLIGQKGDLEIFLLYEAAVLLGAVWANP